MKLNKAIESVNNEIDNFYDPKEYCYFVNYIQEFKKWILMYNIGNKNLSRDPCKHFYLLIFR